MPKQNDDLFDRLRRAGVRKPVAKTLSGLTQDAGKKATTAGHKAVAELRALADEIEKRLPIRKPKADAPSPPAPAPAASTTPAARTKRPAARATPAASSKRPAARATPAASSKRPAGRTSPAAARANGAGTAKGSTSRSRSTTARSGSAAPTSTAPRGENKAKILASLKTGPQTASEVSQQTGIPTATVSAALTRLTKSGEVTKADRGYALPS